MRKIHHRITLHHPDWFIAGGGQSKNKMQWNNKPLIRRFG